MAHEVVEPNCVS
jgi:signal transduction histidine kinase